MKLGANRTVWIAEDVRDSRSDELRFEVRSLDTGPLASANLPISGEC